jgi:predicted  nucleic acid-binding Zn-ribbon protein
MSAELQQVLDSISELKAEFTASENRLENKIEEARTELKAELKEAKLDAKLFNTKFDYYQQATQWVIILSFTLIVAATAITIFASVFTFR